MLYLILLDYNPILSNNVECGTNHTDRSTTDSKSTTIIHYLYLENNSKSNEIQHSLNNNTHQNHLLHMPLHLLHILVILVNIFVPRTMLVFLERQQKLCHGFSIIHNQPLIHPFSMEGSPSSTLAKA